MKDIAIIMCTWKRIENFNKTLNMLSNQTEKEFDFFVWNNNINIIDELNKIKDEYKDKFIFNLKHSDKNVGGFGRYLLAKELDEKYTKIIFIDDDQTFLSNMVFRFIAEFQSNAIKSRWAFRFNSLSYYDRYRVMMPNLNVHYCGTGGMILPASVFKCEELFKIPSEYQFVEDLWLCFIANHYLGFNLKSLKSDFINQNIDGKDQSTIDFLTVKDKLLKYLVNERQWKILTT
jgi:hypothetical protein